MKRVLKFVCLGLLLCSMSTLASSSVEGFEGLTPGPNNPIPSWAPTSGLMVVGAISPFTFASGVSYTAPVPNSGLAGNRLGGGLVGDSTLGLPDWGLGSNGRVKTGLFGTAYFGCDAANCIVTFTFASPQSSVGAFVDPANEGPLTNLVTENAYDIHGRLVGTAMISGVPVANWGTNFIDINAPGISNVTFSGYFYVLDDLTFTASAAPEPGSVALFSWGVVGLGGLLRYRSLI